VVTDTFAFDGFGNLVARTGSTPNQYLYRGEALDAGTGMYYLRARWYRPGLGRFLSRDSFEGEGFAECDCIRPKVRAQLQQHHNLYSYGNMDPVNRIDPTGHLSKWDRLSLIVGAIGLYGTFTTIRDFVQCVGTYLVAAAEAVAKLDDKTAQTQNQLAVCANGLFDGIVWPFPGIPAPWRFK